MKKPYLIQRLKVPYKTDTDLHCNVSQLTCKEKLISLFNFDYMGSAEFEWGAIPTAFESLGKQELVAYKDGDVFIISPIEIKDEVTKWVSDVAKDENSHHTKEYIGLQHCLNSSNPSTKTIGWLKVEENKICDEPFMFFTSKEMFINTCKVLNLNINIEDT